MIRTKGSPNRNQVEGVKPIKFELVPVIQAPLDGGMDTSHDAANLKDNEFTELANCRVIYNDIVRRPGSLLYTPIKPNSSSVLTFTPFVRANGTVLLLRFNPAGIHQSTGVAWNVATGTLIGGANDRITSVVVSDRFFFANNGADYIQEYNPGTNAFARLGNWDKYRFITGFGERLVGANLQSSTIDPSLITWSGILDYGETDPLVNPTAGSQPLVDSSSDRTDSTSGIFSASNTIQVFREHSIWEGTNTASPTQPFNFYAKVTGLGCNAPYSIKRIPFGFAFTDTASHAIYVYGNDGSVSPIDLPIRESIFNSNIDPNTVFAGYNKRTQEYQLAVVSSVSNLVKVFTYSFVGKVWNVDEYSGLTALDILDYSSSTLAYDDLIGTYDDLIGSYNNLTNSNSVTTKFLGYSTGELAYESSLADDDWGNSYETRIISKEFELPIDDTDISELRVNYTSFKYGTMDLYYSKDGGNNWILARSITPTALGYPELKIKKKLIRSRRFKWQIKSTSGLMKVSKFGAWVTKAGDSRK